MTHPEMNSDNNKDNLSPEEVNALWTFVDAVREVRDKYKTQAGSTKAPKLWSGSFSDTIEKAGYSIASEMDNIEKTPTEKETVLRAAKLTRAADFILAVDASTGERSQETQFGRLFKVLDFVDEVARNIKQEVPPLDEISKRFDSLPAKAKLFLNDNYGIKTKNAFKTKSEQQSDRRTFLKQAIYGGVGAYSGYGLIKKMVNGNQLESDIPKR